MLLALTLVLSTCQATPEAPPDAWRMRVLAEGPHGPMPAQGAVVRAAYRGSPLADMWEPLPDAVVDANGEARVDLAALALRPPLDLGDVWLEASIHHPGFRGEQAKEQLTALHRRAGSEEVLEVLLTPGLELAGRVVDPSGRPVREALAVARPWSEDGGPPANAPLRTDGTGTFTLALEQPFAGWIEAFHPRFGLARVDLGPGELFPVLVLAPRLEPVRGSVVGRDGQPLPGHAVCLAPFTTGDQRFGRRLIASSDALGRLELHLPTASPWRLAPWPPTPRSEEQLVVPGSDGVIVRAEGHHIEVELLDAEGRAVHGVVRFARVVEGAAGWRVDPAEWHHVGRGVGRFLRNVGTGSSLRDAGTPGTFALRATALGLGGSRHEAEALLRVEPGRSLTRLTLTLRDPGTSVPLEVHVHGATGELLPAWRGHVLSAQVGFPVLELTDRGVPLRSCMATTYREPRLPPGEYVLQLETVEGAPPSETPFTVHPFAPARLTIHAYGIANPKKPLPPTPRRPSGSGM